MRARLLAVACVAATLPACVRAGWGLSADGALTDGAPTGDASAADASPDISQPKPWTAFSFNSFEGLWGLPHTLAWYWACPVPPADFSHYLLCIATDAAALEQVTDDCLGPDDDETLADPGADPGSGPSYHQGMTYGLQPQTTYYARVWAYNQAGEAVYSDVASQTTAAVPAGKAAIFDDSLPAGASLVSCKLGSTKPYSGTKALEATVVNNNWTQIGIQGLAVTLPGMTAARFEQAYVEMFVDQPQAREVRTLMDGALQQMLYSPPLGYVTVDGQPGYQRIQFPLKRLTEFHTGDPNPAKIGLADVAQIKSTTLNAYFGPGTVRIDAISIIY